MLSWIPLRQVRERGPERGVEVKKAGSRLRRLNRAGRVAERLRKERGEPRMGEIKYLGGGVKWVEELRSRGPRETLRGQDEPGKNEQ